MIITRILTVGFATLLLLSGCTQSVVHEPAESSTTDIFFDGVSTSITSYGLFHSQNNPILFTSFDTGDTVVFCDKPNCRHEGESLTNPNPTCLAQINGVTAFTIYDNRQFFAICMDDSPITIGVYTADANGGNRKKLTSIDASFVTGVWLLENMYILSYFQQYTLDEDGFLQELEQNIAGLIVLDLKTNQIILTPIKTAYDSLCTVFSVENDVIVYASQMYNQMPPHYEYNEIGWEAYRDWLFENQITTIYQFDTITKEELVIIRDYGTHTFLGIIEDYLIATNRTQTELYLVSKESGNFYEIAKTNNGRIDFIQTKEGEIYYYKVYEDKFSYFVYNISTNISTALNEDSVTSYTVRYISSDYVVCYGNDDGEFSYYIMDKDDFLKGHFSNARHLMHYNHLWGDFNGACDCQSN